MAPYKAALEIDKSTSGISHIYQPLRSSRIWHKVNSKAEFNRFEFRVFLLLG